MQRIFVVIHPDSKCMTCTFVLTSCFYSSCVASVSSLLLQDSRITSSGSIRTHFPSILNSSRIIRKQQFGGRRSQFSPADGRSSSAARGTSAPDRNCHTPSPRHPAARKVPPHSARADHLNGNLIVVRHHRLKRMIGAIFCHLSDPLKRMGLAILRIEPDHLIRIIRNPRFLQCLHIPLWRCCPCVSSDLKTPTMRRCPSSIRYLVAR